MNTNTFTDLILLIGTNPLPNFVVAEYFLQPSDSNIERIWLIHSEKNDDIQEEGTKSFAENLQNLLRKKHPELERAFEFIALSNVSRAKSIERDLQERCLPELAGKSVHLNHTGGTKAMATHVYRCNEKQQGILQPSFSYLDAREFKIVFDDEQTQDSVDLRQKISLKFGEMIALHGFTRKPIASDDDEFPFSDAVAAFKQIIQEKKLATYFNVRNGGYCRALLTKKKSKDLATKTSHLDFTAFNAFHPNDEFESVLNALPPGYRIWKDGTFTAQDFKNNACCKETIRFLDGIWLEEYLYTILKHAFRHDQYISIEKNWEIYKPGWDTNFELDILLIKGYQLIGISCTRDSTKSRCKGKGFEIIQRTRQIGGIEAKAVVVTFLDTATRKIVEKELQMDTGSGKNIMVLGIDDLAEETFLKSIREFIQE